MKPITTITKARFGWRVLIRDGGATVGPWRRPTLESARRLAARQLELIETEPPMYDRVRAGCMDCDFQTGHRTLSEAEASILAHMLNFPDHRPLVSDTNG